tara:strand:- start:1192 stop:1569 length:378 start_codon:yes stop_codon:yes gene_type:complete
MNKLFEMFERAVDEKIIAKTTELKGSQFRNTNRIADLERRLDGAVDMIEIQRGWIEKLGGGHDWQNISQLVERIESLEEMIEDYKIIDIYSAAESAVADIDFDTYAMDAVQTILSRENFKIILGE